MSNSLQKTGSGPSGYPDHLHRVDADERLAGSDNVSPMRQELRLTLQEKASVLENTWFATMSPALRHAIFACATTRRVHAGAVVWQEGAAATGWYCVASGGLISYKSRRHGRRVAVDSVAPGEWLGDLALAEREPVAHDTIAWTRSTLLCVSPHGFHELRNQFPELDAARARLYATRERQMAGLLGEAVSLPIRERTHRMLMRMAARFGEEDGGDLRIAVPMTQQTLADLVRASRQRVNGSLQELQEQGALRLERHHMVLLGARHGERAAC